MKNVYLANTDFEYELSNPFGQSIEQNWERHPTCMQLQFLPLLYSSPNDLVAVSALPDPVYLKNLQSLLNSPLATLIPLKEIQPFYNLTCLSWGPSLQVQAWARERQMNYPMPTNWSMVQQINSKEFSVKYSPLSESIIIDSFSTLKGWLESFTGTKVLKTCFGLSGLGHLIIDDNKPEEKISAFCLKEWQNHRRIIGEPWLNRLFDFSTQWFLSKEGQVELLGSTVFETNSKGGYLGTLAGDESSIFHLYLPYLHEHICLVREMLGKIFELGYFGHIGVDAFLYKCRHTNETCLYPIVEINGRQTLSYVALRLQQLRFSDQVIRLSFKTISDEMVSLLPRHLKNGKGKTFSFKRQLVVDKCKNEQFAINADAT